MFGCLRARDMRGIDAVIIIYENIHCRYVDIMPYPGDLLLCRKLHSSVYVPLHRIIQSNLCLRHLDIPGDILMEYFPIYERLRH